MIGLHGETTKRLHLNILIQGAAIDASSDLTPIPELDAIHGQLNHLNQLVGVGMQLSQFEGRSLALTGWTASDPRRFWRAIEKRSHPFFRSRLLRTHGLALADATYDDGADRAVAVGMMRVGARRHDRQLLETIKKLYQIESQHRTALEQLVRTHTALAWGIPVARLTAALHNKNSPGLMLEGQVAPDGLREKLNAMCAAGWSRVVFDPSGAPSVEARALVFSLVRHELVKGIAELCCMHGLAHLDNETYSAVIDTTDKVTLERHGMQVGPTLYRWWRDALPAEASPAAGLMQLSLADPDIVESALIAVVEDPNAAREIMTHLCGDSIVGHD